MKIKQRGVSTEMNKDSINNKAAKTHKLNYLSGIFCAFALFMGAAQASQDIFEVADCIVKMPKTASGNAGEVFKFYWMVIGPLSPNDPKFPEIPPTFIPQVLTSLNDSKILTRVVTDPNQPMFDNIETAMYVGPMFNNVSNWVKNGKVGDWLNNGGIRIKVINTVPVLDIKGQRTFDTNGNENVLSREVIFGYMNDNNKVQKTFMLDKVPAESIECTPRY